MFSSDQLRTMIKSNVGDEWSLLDSSVAYPILMEAPVGDCSSGKILYRSDITAAPATPCDDHVMAKLA